MLVGTHLDVAGSKAGLEQAAALTALVYPRFGHVFEMEPAVLCLDSHAANSQEVKKFKSLLQERKQRVIEVSNLYFLPTNLSAFPNIP